MTIKLMESFTFDSLFIKKFKRKALHFDKLAERRFNRLWEGDNYSLWEKLKFKFNSQFYEFYFDDTLPSWRKRIRTFTKELRYSDIDFFILSPIKVGSSQLAITLFSNPKIASPVVKEFIIKGPDQDSKYFPVKNKKYKKVGYVAPFLFEPTYRRNKLTLESIKKHYPNSKLIIALRNPVKRAYSHWKWEYFLAGKTGLDKKTYLDDFNMYVEQAIKHPENEPSNYSGFSFLKSGLYNEILSELSENINRENLYFLDMDLYFNNPKQELKKIQKYIGLSTIYEYPNKLPFINENPIKFNKSLVTQETYKLLSQYYFDDIRKIQGKTGIGSNWLKY